MPFAQLNIYGDSFAWRRNRLVELGVDCALGLPLRCQERLRVRAAAGSVVAGVGGEQTPANRGEAYHVENKVLFTNGLCVRREEYIVTGDSI